MDTVLVTGGTGHLGRDLVTQLQQRTYRVRVLARTPGRDPAIEWVRGDLAGGEGIAEAVAGAHTIVHAATLSPAAQRGRFRPGDCFRSPPDVDVQGTRRLLAEATQAGASHVLHASVVGVQASRVPYSRVKAAARCSRWTPPTSPPMWPSASPPAPEVSGRASAGRRS
jgi:nucleoside-diphosphate-sugar epimerase